MHRRSLSIVLVLALIAPACDRSVARDGGEDAPPADSAADVRFAEAMEELARLEAPCLTSGDSARRDWSRHELSGIRGSIRLPPRFEAQPTGDSLARRWANPDSALVALHPSFTADGEHAVGAGFDGHPERRCSLKVSGRDTRVVELRRQRPGRGDSTFGAVMIAVPRDDLTIWGEIAAPTRQARAELLVALSTISVPETP